MLSASFDARYTQAAATSSVVINLLNSVLERRICSLSGAIAFLIVSVITTEGPIAFTLMLYGAHSAASMRVIISTDPFVAPYVTLPPSVPRIPRTEDRLIILPCFFSIIILPMTLQGRTTPLTLIRNSESHVSRLISDAGILTLIPWALTRMSIVSYFLTALSASSLT